MLPLANQRVIICRAAADATPLLHQLSDLGAEVVSIPLVEPTPPPDNGAALAEAVSRLNGFTWVAVTSANGSRAVLACLKEMDQPWPSKVRIGCVGSATARVFTEVNIGVELQTSVSSASGLVRAFPEAPKAEVPPTVLAPIGVLASNILPDGLAEKGYQVERINAYDTVAAPVTSQQKMKAAAATAILFTSSSTVERFVAALGADAVPATVICIGPQTEATAKAAGIVPTAVASVHTQGGVVDSLVATCVA